MKIRTNTKIESRICLIDTRWEDEPQLYEEFKDFCELNGYEVEGNAYDMRGVAMGKSISYYEWKGGLISDETQEFWDGLKAIKDSPYIDYYVVTGSLGLWNGKHTICPKTFNNLYDAMSACANDAWDFDAHCDGKVIEVNAYHHDGTNSFEIRKISWEDCDKLEWWDDDKDGDMETFIVKAALPISYEMVGCM